VDELVVELVVEVLIVLSSSCPDPFSPIIASVPPATGRIWPPTETDPPMPTPTTSHPTWALAVWPLRIVNVLEAVTSGVIKGVWEIVEFAAVFAGEDSIGNCGAVAGWDARELTDVGFRPVVDLTSVGFGPAVELRLLV